MELLSFQLKGDYALFTKPYANNQMQSFLIPPKTALAGMVGAILGFGKDGYIERIGFDNLKIGIQVLSLPRKDLFGINFMQGEGVFNLYKNPLREPPEKGERSPTRLEVLKDIRYRIYLYHPDIDIFDKLADYIENNKCIFVPYLGTESMFADISEFKRIFGRKIQNVNKEYQFVSILPEKKVSIKIEKDIPLFRETVPVRMEADRSGPQTGSFIFTTGENEILARISNLHKILPLKISFDKNIILF